VTTETQQKHDHTRSIRDAMRLLTSPTVKRLLAAKRSGRGPAGSGHPSPDQGGASQGTDSAFAGEGSSRGGGGPVAGLGHRQHPYSTLASLPQSVFSWSSIDVTAVPALLQENSVAMPQATSGHPGGSVGGGAVRASSPFQRGQSSPHVIQSPRGGLGLRSADSSPGAVAAEPSSGRMRGNG